MSVDFWTLSGWLFGLISLIFGVIQFFQKTKYKKELNKFTQKQTIKGNGTGYQSMGDINIGK